MNTTTNNTGTEMDCGCGAGERCGEEGHCDLADAWAATFCA